MTTPPTLWRPQRPDFLPISAIILVPLLAASPQLLGFFNANPMLYIGNLGQDVTPGWLSGTPYIDPNVGFTAQALGKLALYKWMHGIIPWWNSFNGIGLPLAGEYQSAVFSPFTVFIYLPNGIVWLHIALQVVTGCGFYSLSRQLGLEQLASLTGGLLLAQNGTLAWFGETPNAPAVFLPWVLLGIEHAAAQTARKWFHGWQLFALATGLMLLAGFPETAYICGLFGFVWAAFRMRGLPNVHKIATAWRLGLGASIGLALSAPQILVFLEFLPLAIIGNHSDGLANFNLGPLGAFPSLVAPYIFGPIFEFQSNQLNKEVWDFIGGYVDSLELTVAAFGLWYMRDSLNWMLFGWITLSVCRTFGVQPFSYFWNFVPGMPEIMFCRYSAPTWEFAIITLVAFGIDALKKNMDRIRISVLAAGIVSLVTATFLLTFAAKVLPYEHFANLHSFTLTSVIWAVLSSALAVTVLVWFPQSWRAPTIAFLLVVDATIMFAIPTLSNPRSGTVDTAAIEFLKSNLGLQRFYTLGPIAPNYGAYFNIASINHNYLPVPKLWGDWIAANLDTAVDPILFTGFSHPDPTQPTPAQELITHFPAYEEVGVKYVVAPTGVNPFIKTKSAPVVQKVYSDSLMEIYQLPAPKPYFEALGDACRLQPQSRTKIIVDCDQATTLVRRELFFPGWQARVNGQSAPIAEQNGLFQSVTLPAGRSTISYAYAPPHIVWAWLAMWLALITLIAPSLMRTNKPA